MQCIITKKQLKQASTSSLKRTCPTAMCLEQNVMYLFVVRMERIRRK